MKKKIVLYFPPPFTYERSWKGVPLALLSISRVLDSEGYDIKIITDFLSEDHEKEILKYAKDSICLGISAMTGFQIFDGLKISEMVKSKYPNIPIVWGGWHPSLLPEETIRNKNIDIVIKGQGDRTFPELVHALERGTDLKKIQGIVFKRGSRTISTPSRELEDINDLPPMPYHLIDMEKCILSTEYGKRTIPYISSYGCPHRCGFCVEQIVNKRRWKALKAERVIKEWEYLIKKYRADSIAIYDSNFFVDKKRVYDICRGLLKKNLKIRWGNANGRVSQMVRYEPEIWQAMKDSGCSMILTGAESGDQDALDLINKDMDVKEIEKFTMLCKRYDIKILFSFLVGLPWSSNPKENREFINKEYRLTFSLIDKLLKISNRNRFTYYIFLPYPGAPLYMRAVNLGLRSPKTLKEWSTYLLSPEDAFNVVTKQKWITPKQARLTAMLTQYIFGLMDEDTYEIFNRMVSKGLKRHLFKLSFIIGKNIVRARWRFKFFDVPIDYKLFSIIYKHSNF